MRSKAWVCARAKPLVDRFSVADVLSVFAMWMVMGMVKLPKSRACFDEGRLPKILEIIGLPADLSELLPARNCFDIIQASLQWSDPKPVEERVDRNGRHQPTCLIDPLCRHMQQAFANAWIPGRELTADESLWAFKGRTFMKNS